MLEEVGTPNGSWTRGAGGYPGFFYGSGPRKRKPTLQKAKNQLFWGTVGQVIKVDDRSDGSAINAWRPEEAQDSAGSNQGFRVTLYCRFNCGYISMPRRVICSVNKALDSQSPAFKTPYKTSVWYWC